MRWQRRELAVIGEMMLTGVAVVVLVLPVRVEQRPEAWMWVERVEQRAVVVVLEVV
jgi:hypothetical protein